MKNIQSANTKKGFAKRMAEEKEEKNEVKDAKLMGERGEKGASDELARKTDDKDLWKQLNEIKAKMEARRQTAMELSNKAGDTAREQIREDKKERDTEDKKNQANEKELKALAASGTNKTDVAVQNPDEKKTEKQKLEQVQGKEEDKSITPKGFAGTFWAGVTGVQNLGNAITKVGTMAVTKKE